MEIHSACGSTWQTWSPGSYLYILCNKTLILLERHEQGYQKINSSLHTLPQGKKQKFKLTHYKWEILKWLFNKIAIDLVTECETSYSGNKHILTITDHLTGWPEVFPIPDKSADTIVSTFINYYLPVHICPRYILLDNGTEFKNHLMDQVLQELGTYCIFSAPYQLQSNRKLEVFHNYLKPTLKKLSKRDPTNWYK